MFKEDKIILEKGHEKGFCKDLGGKIQDFLDYDMRFVNYDFTVGVNYVPCSEMAESQTHSKADEIHITIFLSDPLIPDDIDSMILVYSVPDRDEDQSIFSYSHKDFTGKIMREIDETKHIGDILAHEVFV